MQMNDFLIFKISIMGYNSHIGTSQISAISNNECFPSDQLIKLLINDNKMIHPLNF